jgi:hypothetical protein
MSTLNSKVAEVVYVIETGRMSPMVACREYGVDRYEVEDARRKLEPGHRFDENEKVWTKRPIWVRKSR